MDVLEAIRTRRSIGKVGPERPPRELIERLLEAATAAPNHHLTEPWRLIVLTGRAREELGEVTARALARHNPPDMDPAQARARYEADKAKPLRAPVVIAVAAELREHPKAQEIEEVEAVAAATQNLLLAAHALGLGAMWRTGPAAYEPAVKAFLGLQPRDHIVGFLYVGYPAAPPAPVPRAPLAAKTEWRGWDA